MTMVLSRRALNRATLARQLLLHRADMPAFQAIEHLVGLQGQAPLAPYVSLWSRLTAFHTEDLSGLLTARQVVRTPLMRATVHLVSAADCLGFWPLIQPALTRRVPFFKELDGVPLDELAAAGRELLAQPATNKAFGAVLAERWPGRPEQSLAGAVRFLVSAIQAPPRGLWGQTGPVAWVGTEAWLGRPLDPDPAPDPYVLRYLGAFGPASVKDIQAWSGLTKLREVVDRLRPQLMVFRDEHGVELFDLPDAPRPDPDTPAPPRFLAEYDNILLSHADRSRVIPDGRNPPLPPGQGATMGTVLVDGDYSANWRITDGELTIEPLREFDMADVEAEGARLLKFTSG